MGTLAAVVMGIVSAIIELLRRRAPEPVVTDAPRAPHGLREHVRDRLRRHRERASGADPADGDGV